MGEMILGIVILALIIERFFFAREMTARLGDTIKAVMSRNINEYISATTVPDKKEAPPENDEVDMSTLTTEEFDTMIKKIV